MMTLSASSSHPLWLQWRVQRGLGERCRTGRNERLLRGTTTDEKQAASNIFILPVKATRALRHGAQGAHLAKRAEPSWADQSWTSRLKWVEIYIHSVSSARIRICALHNVCCQKTFSFSLFSVLSIKQRAEIFLLQCCIFMHGILHCFCLFLRCQSIRGLPV